MPDLEPIIQIKDLSYAPVGVEHDVLKQVNLEINPGDFALLLGPPGCYCSY